MQVRENAHGCSSLPSADVHSYDSFMERSSTPPAYHHGDLRNALISEGRRLLEEIGARELSLRHVARSVGVSIAAPSHHFEGKEGLLAAMAAEGFIDLPGTRRKIAAAGQGPVRRG